MDGLCPEGVGYPGQVCNDTVNEQFLEPFLDHI